MFLLILQRKAVTAIQSLSAVHVSNLNNIIVVFAATNLEVYILAQNVPELGTLFAIKWMEIRNIVADF